MKNSMNIVITGSSGFIGTNFIKMSPNFIIKEVDLLTTQIEMIDFSGIDSILHLAALVHQMKGAPEDLYFKVNRDLAFNVAQRAKEYGVKHFVLMSTGKVYGESSKETYLFNEESPCNPLDPYGISKLEAEQLIKGLEDENFKVAIIRSPLVYGSGVKANMFNLIKLVDKIAILPFGGINNFRSVVYIGNLVALLQHIINNQVSGIFIAGDKSPISTTELVKLIGKGLGKKRRLIKVPKWILKIASYIKPAFVDRLFGSLVLDNSHTNDFLKYIPPYSSEEGLRDMVAWYKTRLGE